MAGVLMRDNDMDESQALALAAVAEGSLGRARLLLDENLLALRQELVEHLLFSQNNPAETVPQVLRMGEKCAALKENIYELLTLLRLWYRDLVLIAAGAPETSTANKDIASCLEAAKERWSMAQLYVRLSLLDRAERQLLRNCSRTLVLETLFFDLI
jgi:DNA polymerase-3 subunit delta'